MNPLMSKIKSLLQRSPLLVSAVRRVRYWRNVRRLKGPKLMQRFAQLYPEAYFIQIGSNDGKQLDHLQTAILNQHWCGIMIEPVPYVFARLRRNYGHLKDRVQLENVAIGERNGSMPFWHLRQAATDDPITPWYDALGSFRKDVILKHAIYIPDLEQRLTCTEVPTLTFAELCERHRVGQVDLIQMDTEGYDYEIIKRIDFARYRPALLIYEHHHFDAQTQAACEARLRGFGYDVVRESIDTWCVDRQARDPRQQILIDYWQTLLRKYGRGRQTPASPA
ncbi:MAG: FkbM family methyltransferase [Stenotrophobium sp.]